jgi:hypothetical protein
MEQYRCEPPFWIDPFVLFQNFSLQYKPSCEHSPWNFAARIMILSVIVGLIASMVGDLSFLLVVVLFGALTAGAIIMMTEKPVSVSPPVDISANIPDAKMNDKKGEYKPLPYVAVVDPSHSMKNDPSRSKENYATEHFINGGSAPNGVQPFSEDGFQMVTGRVEVDAAPYAGPALPDYTPPTSKNLFMNVLLDEYKYNPNRPAAAPVGNGIVKQTLDDYFRVHWFSDPTDVFGKSQNQRQFVTQPSTTVPNDQGSFANWLYKIPGKTCKEGGRAACLAGTDGGMIPWLGQAS